jgi:hypothetical protein
MRKRAMTSNEIEDLVFDTLYYRRMVADSCLQVNLAAHELEQQSADALPRIERVLSTVVVPALTQVRNHPFPGSSETSYEEDPFPGLSGLLGAYMLIGSKHDVTRAVGFLGTLPPALQAKAVALVPVFFRKGKVRPQEKEANNLKEPPDERLLSFVKEASQTENPVLRENAIWAMSFFPE